MLRMVRRFLFSYLLSLRLRVRFGRVWANGWVSPGRMHPGSNCHFNGLRVYGGGNVFIGDNFHSGKDCIFLTAVHDYHGESLPYGSGVKNKDIRINENVWLGMGVRVLGGVTIGEGSIIQAFSVVVSDIPPLSIAGGHPAKVFKMRDAEHYYFLKENKCFI